MFIFTLWVITHTLFTVAQILQLWPLGALFIGSHGRRHTRVSVGFLRGGWFGALPYLGALQNAGAHRIDFPPQC